MIRSGRLKKSRLQLQAMKMRAHLVFGLLLSVAAGAAMSSPLKAEAGAGAGMRIAIVDLQQALNGVDEGRAAREKFKKELEGKQKEIDKRKADLQVLQKELEDLQTKMSSGLLKPEAMDQARKKQADFQKRMEEYAKYVEGSQSEMARKEQEATSGIIGRMRELVQTIGRNDGFNMIYERNQSGLLYASSYTDITERLIQEYNKSGGKAAGKKK